jgi:large subunit ribosomal protein L15
MKRGFEGGQMPLHRRIPKRGFTNIFRTEYAVVNVDQIESRFEAGAVVDPDALRARRLVSRSRMPVKLLARGGVTKALTVRVHRASAEARKKIEAAGGKVELL